MRYHRGDIITARGIRCEVDTHVTDADIVPGGDTGLEVVICTALEELPGRHVEGSTLYVTLDEIEERKEVAALSYALEPLDADALRSAVRRLTNGSVGGAHTRALSKSTLVMLLNDLVTDRFFNRESPESVERRVQTRHALIQDRHQEEE